MGDFNEPRLFNFDLLNDQNICSMSIVGASKSGKSKLIAKIVEFLKKPVVYVNTSEELEKFQQKSGMILVITELATSWVYKENLALTLVLNAKRLGYIVIFECQIIQVFTPPLRNNIQIFFIGGNIFWSKSDKKSIYDRHFGYFHKLLEFEKYCEKVGKYSFLISGFDVPYYTKIETHCNKSKELQPCLVEGRINILHELSECLKKASFLVENLSKQ